MAKQILFSDDARKKMLEGVEKIAHAVRSTMGPSGKAVVSRRGRDCLAASCLGVPRAHQAHETAI